MEDSLGKNNSNIPENNSDNQTSDEGRNERYLKSESEKSQNKQSQQELEEILKIEEPEEDLAIDLLIAQKKKKEPEKKIDIKKLKKLTRSQRDKDREKLIKKALKYGFVKERDYLQASVTDYSEKNPIKASLKKLINRISEFRLHAIIAPGDQAGVFDNIKYKPKTRPDFDFGPQAIEKHFTTSVGDTTVEGTVFGKIDDVKGTGAKIEKVEQINVSKAQIVGGSNISYGNLGNISPSAISNSIKKDGLER